MSLDIIDVADELGLRRGGQRGDEVLYFDDADTDTPDLQINPSKNKWYTFAAGQNTGGGFVDLVQHKKNCSREEAKDWLARKFADDYSDKTKERIERERKAREVIEKAVQLAQDTLHKRRKAVKQKIKDNRNFTDEDIEEGKIGFLSRDDAKTLESRFSDQELIDSGIFTETDNGVYCHLQNRIIYPYLNSSKPVYAAGRALPEDMDEDTDKYRKTVTTDYNRHILYQFREGRDDLVITEGFTDSISAKKAGYDVITPATTQFKKDQIKQIQKISQHYDNVYIINDGDEAGEEGASKTAEALIEIGHNPYIVQLEEGKDLDDWTTENGYDITELTDKAPRYLQQHIQNYQEKDGAEKKKAKKQLFKLVADWDQSDRETIWDKFSKSNTKLEYELQKYNQQREDRIETRAFEEYVETENGQKQFRPKFLGEDIRQDYDFVHLRDSQQFLVYKDGYWKDDGENTVKEVATARLGDKFDPSYVNKSLEYIQNSTLRHRQDFQCEDRKLNLKNGVYDLDRGELIPHSPAYNFPFKVPWEYKPGAECPKIDKFLDQVTNGDEKKKEKIYQLAGWCLLPSIPFAKAGMLAGSGGNGKTIIIELLKNLLGKNSNNYTNRSLQELEDSFDTHDLYGTLACFDDDLPPEPLTDTDKFKKLTGGSDQNAEIKYGASYDFQPYSTFVFAANHIPPTTDESRGFYRRWLIVHLPVNFVDNPAEDNELEKKRRPKPELMDEITSKDEMQGFLKKSIESLETVLDNNGFRHARDVEEVREKWKEHSTPVVAFIQKFLKQGVTKNQDERSKNMSDNPNWNDWEFDYINQDCLKDLITAYTKSRMGREPKRGEIKEALEESEIFCNYGTQTRREPDELSTSSGTARVISGVKIELPEKRPADIPPFMYTIPQKKYSDSNQSISYGSTEKNVYGIVNDYVADNYNNGEGVEISKLIDEIVEEHDLDCGRDEVEEQVDELINQGELYEPRSGFVSKL